MKIILFYLAVLGCTVAVPSGYYHQEYNYKTSASSFKNNELQHKTDDQGYYRKDGDLDGRVKPVVDANSEHSEYVNPNSQSGQYYGGANTDFSSTGNMRAQSGYNGYGSSALDAEGLARSDRIIGSTGYSSGSNTDFSSIGGYNGYGSHALDAERLAQSGRITGNTGYSSGYSSGYGSSSLGSSSLGSSSQSYGTSSNLRLITSRLQQELESDLQEAVRQNNIYPQTRVDISQLERELKQNLTERLNNELSAKFGQQMVRGGMSYTITGGRLQSTANYDNEELSNLRSQLENSLLNQLRTQYSSSSSSNSQYYNSQGSYGYTTTVRPVYYSVYPSLPSYTSTVRYPVDYNNANYQTVRYTPITNPQSITNIASRVQTQLDTRLNELLDETNRKYSSSDSSYSLTNTDVLLERIRNELKSNLTYLLDEDIRNNYGTQIQRDGYLYSVGPSGQTSTDYNYSLRDLEKLKQQVENNLIEKLNRDFETHRSSWSSHQSYNSQSSYGSNYQYSSTPRYYEVVTAPRQSYVNPYPTSASNQAGYIKTGSSASNQYGYASGSQQSGYTSGSQQSGYGMQSSSSIAQLQRKLQDDLSRQLRGALSTSQYTSYSSNGAYNPQNYQTTLQQLSDELNRNLTRHLQEYSAMGSYAAYGNFDSAQMQRLKTQLQDSLMSQLQQGLQQSYQASSSYSSSSSSSSNSNYRPVRGFQNYQAGQYRSGIETVAGEDCAGDDSNAYSYVRAKRSYGFPSSNGNDQAQQNLHFGQYQGNRGSSHQVRHPTELGQELVDYDLTQQMEDSGFGENSNYGRVHDQIEVGQQIDDNNDYKNEKLQVSHLGQQVDDSDLIQQVEDSHYGKLQVSGQGQHIYDSDLTQQIEVGQQIDENDDYKNDKLQVSHLGQHVDESDSTQQVEDSHYGKLQVSGQGQQIYDTDLTQQIEVGQQIDDNDDYKNDKLQVSHLGQQVDESDLTEQVEDSHYGKLQVSGQGQQIYDADLTQQVEDSAYGKLQVSNQGQQQVQDYDNGKLHISNQGQQVDDSELILQVQDLGYGKLQVPNQGQQVDNAYLTQQVDDSDYRKLQFLNQGQQVDNSDSIPQIQDLGKLQVSNQGPYVDDSDLTQQVEDSGYGRQQISNQGQQVDNLYLTQQVEDSDYRKLQFSNQGQEVDNSDSTPQVQDSSKLQVSNQGQYVDDSDLTQQVEDSGYGKLQISNQGQQFDNSYLTQQVDNSDYGKLQHIDDKDMTQQVEDTDSYGSNQEHAQNSGLGRRDPELPAHLINGQVNDLDSTQQVEHDGFGQHHPQHTYQLGRETGDSNNHFGQQQVDDSELMQQVVDHPGVGQNHPQYLTELKPEIEDSNNKNEIGQELQQVVDFTQQIQQFQNPEVPDQGQISEFGQQVRDERPIEPEGLGQQTEKPEFVSTDQERVVPQSEGVTPDHQLGSTANESGSENEYEKIENLCLKYIDTSLMDAPWTLSNQLGEEINREYHLLSDGTTESQKDILFQKIMAKLPKNIMNICFHVDGMKLSEQEEDQVVLGLENYFKSLIKQKIDNVVQDDKINKQNLLKQSEKVEATENENHVNQELDESLTQQEIESSYMSIEDWCRKYIDISMMDAPWRLGIQLKSTIAKQCRANIQDGDFSSKWQFIYERVLNEIPINITDCFNMNSMGLNEVQLVEKRRDIGTYLKSLINNEVVSICQLEDDSASKKQGNDNSPKIEYNPVPVETLLSGPTTEKSTTSDNQYLQSQYTNEIGRPAKVNELPTSNQFIETNPKREENLPQPQLINGGINEVNVPQSVTTKQSEVVITDQGQFFHQPQTLPEAEHTADSLIDALRRSQTTQTSRPNQQTIYNYPDSHYGSHSYDNGYRNHIYENYRPLGQPDVFGYPHHPEYNNGYNKPIGYNHGPYPASYGSNPLVNKPLNYGQVEVVEQNVGTSVSNHRPYPGSYGSNPYQTPNTHGYSHQPPRYNKPLNYGQVEPGRTGQANIVNQVKPVYSGVKGRNRYSGISYQPALPQPQQPQPPPPQPRPPQLRPPQVQLEPVESQDFVRQDDTAPQAVHETTPLNTEYENLPWWKRFGHKIKQGAADLKSKVIG